MKFAVLCRDAATKPWPTSTKKLISRWRFLSFTTARFCSSIIASWTNGCRSAGTSNWTKTRSRRRCARRRKKAVSTWSLLGERPPTTSPGTRALIAPRFLDIHRISDTHEHIGMIYWARPKIVAQASCLCVSETHGQDARATLAAAEHHGIRWCSADELDKLEPPMSGAVKWYCRKAIGEISRCP